MDPNENRDASIGATEGDPTSGRTDAQHENPSRAEPPVSDQDLEALLLGPASPELGSVLRRLLNIC